MGGENQGRWPEMSVRDAVALGVYLVLLMSAETEDLSAATAQAAVFAGTAVRLTDVLLKALRDTAPGESA